MSHFCGDTENSKAAVTRECFQLFSRRLTMKYLPDQTVRETKPEKEDKTQALAEKTEKIIYID